MADLLTEGQSVGDLTGRAISLYRQNFLLIVQVLLLPSAGATLGKVCMQWGILNLKEASLFLPAIAFCLAGLGLSLWFLWVLTIRQVALVRLLSGAGHDKDFAGAYKTVKARAWAIFGIFVLTHLMVFINVFFFIVEIILLVLIAKLAGVHGVALAVLALLGCLGLMAGALFITLFAFLWFAIIAMGNQSLADVVKEGFVLLGHDPTRSSLFTILLMIAVMALVQPLMLPLLGLSAINALKLHAAAGAWLGIGNYPIFSLVIAQTWESLVNMVNYPIIFFGYGYLYQNLKMRQQASDLVQYLEKLQYGRA